MSSTVFLCCLSLASLFYWVSFLLLGPLFYRFVVDYRMKKSE